MARPVASTPHLIWAGGHFLTFVCGLRYLVGVLFLQGAALSRWYTIAYLGALVSYGVVVYKSFGVPQFTKAYLQRAAMDENVQYLFLAVYWWINKPIFATLIPYVTFSLFHVLTFLRTTIIPMAFPSASQPAPARGSTAAQPPAPTTVPAKTAKFIQTWVKKNYDTAMRFVAYSEVAIFLRILLGALTLRNSLLAPLLYAHFLRLRFYMSSFTRTSFQNVGAFLDHQTTRPECPPVVRRAYLTVMDVVNRYASTVLSVPQGAAATNGPAAANAGGAGGGGAGAAAAGGGAATANATGVQR